MNLPWDWEYLTQNENITMDDINNNMNLQWEWEFISNNPNITIDFIKSHMDLFQSGKVWINISKNPGITFDDYINNKELPWNLNFLSTNPNITLDIILNYKYIKWELCSLCYNPNITLKYLSDNVIHMKNSYYFTVLNNMGNYNTYFNSKLYKKRMTNKLHNTIFDELISISMHPDKLYTSGITNELEYKWNI
jgi:hypothetical protein